MKNRPYLHTDCVSNVANLPNVAAGSSDFVRKQLAGWIGLSALVLAPVTTLISVGNAQADHINCGNNYQRVSTCSGVSYRQTSYRGGSSIRNVSTVNDGVLSIGDEGSEVAALQRRLNNLGYSVAVDGVFGPGTEQAVIAFQADNGLAVDGVVGPATADALRSGSTRPVAFDRPNGCTRPVYYTRPVSTCNNVERPVSCTTECPVSYPQQPSQSASYVVLIPTDSGASLADVRRFFPAARLRNSGLGAFIETGSFTNRGPAEAQSRAARERGFDAQVRYF